METVTISLEYDEDELNLAVSDTGIGIKQAEQAHIFKRFYRCDRTRSAEGCGLGLSYCRAVIRRAGGNIQVKSVHGKGSTFIIRLPVGHFRGCAKDHLAKDGTNFDHYQSNTDVVASP